MRRLAETHASEHRFEPGGKIDSKTRRVVKVVEQQIGAMAPPDARRQGCGRCKDA